MVSRQFPRTLMQAAARSAFERASAIDSACKGHAHATAGSRCLAEEQNLVRFSKGIIHALITHGFQSLFGVRLAAASQSAARTI